MTAVRSLWFPRLARSEATRVRLVCFGGAGTGSTEFATWQAGLPSTVEVWAAQLPGRERRIREAPAASMAELADPLAAELRLEDDGTPWAFFGHSFGALIAYEVARRLAGQVALAGVVAASSVVPHLQATRLPVTSDDDETLLAWAAAANGTEAGLLSDARFARWLAEDLRVTLRIRREYPSTAPEPLPCPVLAIGGAGDADATATDLAQWQQYTAVGLDQLELGQGHFFLRDDRTSLLTALSSHLANWTLGST
ncbi:alpha/beta fold hydrolase [Streptomyces sp. SID13031]|uniref:thioesterase II family protein n=1 Tax=Streptomyces sp. SID13031 TaxID=2706046 RepID=UPI0013C7673D|nr:alpha/beta fold hydrolase [Streptomyces sp. SID13031]NEA30612.1 thioesterase [Streptomyces sp. SID13031]